MGISTAIRKCNLLLALVFLCFAQLGIAQESDVLLQEVEQFYSMPYPERFEAVVDFLKTNKVTTEEVLFPVLQKEVAAAKARDAAPIVIAEILAHKMRVEAQINDLIALAQTTTELRKHIQTRGDLSDRAWKMVLGKAHIMLAHIAYYKYEDAKARKEMAKAIAIFEELQESYMLSECYVEMSRYNEEDAQVDLFYLEKLDSIAQLIPMNRFIVSGLFFKMNNLGKQEKHQDVKALIDKYEKEIISTSPHLTYELKNQMAINAINLNAHQKAYDIYQPLIKELHNKEVIPVIFAQIEIVENFTKLLKIMKRYEEASIYQDTLISLLSQEYTTLRDESIAEAQSKYQQLEDEQKINELELEQALSQSKLRSIVFGLLSLFAIVIGGIGYMLFRQRQKQREHFLLTTKEKETQQVREKLLTSITHELRTPLSIISGKLESLEEAKNKEEQKVHLDVAKQSSKQLVEQINQLLEWNKLEANALTNQPTIGDAEQEMEKILEELKPLAAYKKLEWNIGVKEQNFNGQLDFGKFQTIARNLISNAIKYSQANASIGLKLFQENNELVFAVQDFGPGIPQEHLSKIFDWYYRVATKKESANYEGFGIGLALSKELAELMKGTLTVASVQGKGSTFTLKVPFENLQQGEAEAAQQTTPSAANPMPGKPNTGDTTLLIIEDHPALAAHIASLFHEDYNVLLAHDIEHGKNMAEIVVPDLIISDIMLPDGSGLDLCKKLKSQMITNHIPILMLTARTDEATRYSSLENRADAFLNKPFNNKELQLTVQNLLQNRRILHLRFGNQKEDLAAAADPLSSLVLTTLENNFANGQFDVDAFSAALAMSKGQAYRKIRATFDTTPKKMIRNYRLDKAKQLLDDQAMNISEVAYECGFSSPEYFSTSFREVYQQSPTEYRATE